MSRVYSVSYLTTAGLSPADAVHAAHRAGYQRIGFRFLPAGPGETLAPLLEDDALLADVRAALEQTGLEMADGEIARIGAGTRVEEFRPLLARIAALGGRHLLVAGDDRDRARLIERYGRLTEMAAEFGLTADLEFMGWTGVPDLKAAIEITEATGLPNAGILFDTLHFDRTGAALGEIGRIPRGRLNYVQVCDGPMPYDPSDAGLIEVARTARLIPGMGGIDLAGMLARLPADVPVAVEVPNLRIAHEFGVETLMRSALDATRALCEAAAQG